MNRTPKLNPMDRLPPYSEAAERGALGCIILDPVTGLSLAQEKLKNGPACFYETHHQIIYQTLLEMQSAHQTINQITVEQRLIDAGRLDDAGGRGCIAKLEDFAPYPSALESFLEVIQSKHVMRRISGVCSHYAQAVYGSEDAEALLDQVERDVLAIGELRGSLTEVTASDMAESFAVDFDKRLNGEANFTPSGYRNLDVSLKGGFKPGQFVVIGARPSSGKSALLVNIAAQMAAMGTPVGVISLEMSADELRDRMVSQLSNIDVSQFDSANKPNTEQARVIDKGRTLLKRLPLRIDDGPGKTVTQIKSVARRWLARNGVKVVFVDYLQKVNADRFAGNDRREQVDDIAKNMQRLARELKIVVIAAAQLNRETEKDKARKPRSSDLRESGAIEQDADIIGLIYDPRPSDETEPNPYHAREMRVLLSKNRGSVQNVDLRFTFHPTLTRFDVLENSFHP